MFIFGIIIVTIGIAFFIAAYVTDELIAILPAIMFVLIGIVILFDSDTKKYKVNQNWHYNGEIMVLKDTLIVTQANKLNKLYKDLNPTDSLHEINIIEQCSAPLNNRVLFYDKKGYQLNNKTDNLTVLITKDTIFINTQ